MLNSNEIAQVKSIVADVVEDFAITTSNATPTTVYTYTPTANEHVRVEVVCNAMKDTTATYGAVKARSFYFDGVATNAGTLRTLEADEYLGSGLSTASFTITTSGTDVIVQFTGEASATINANFRILITRVINENLT